MKIDFNQVIKGMDGKPFIVNQAAQAVNEFFEAMEKSGIVIPNAADVKKFGDSYFGKSEAKMTLRDVCTTSLLGTYQDEKRLDGKEKIERWDLAKKIDSAKEPISLKPEEIVKIKELMNKNYATMIYGPACELLEKS